MAGSHHHRSTVKKSHKKFKSKHATKSALKERTKGKVEKDERGVKAHVSSKWDRKNTAKQVKQKKVIELAINRRLFDGRNGAPKITAVIPLVNLDEKTLQDLLVNLIESVELGSSSSSNGSEVSPDTLNSFKSASRRSLVTDIPRFKQKVQFIFPRRSLLDMLDAAKAADFVLFVLSATQEVDSLGELCIRSIESQGVSSVLAVVHDLIGEIPVKQQPQVRSSLNSFFNHFFPTNDKIYSAEIPSEALNLMRTICQKMPRGINWRDNRSYVLADDLQWVEQENLVMIQGVVRGRKLNPDRLVHVPGFGDFQIDRLEALSAAGSIIGIDDNDISSLIYPSSLQDSLDDLAPLPDSDMVDEDEEEDEEEESLGVRLDDHSYFRNEYKEDHEAKIKARRLPKGMSEYQARWIVDDDVIAESELEEEDSEDDKMEEGSDGEDEEDELTDGEDEDGEYMDLEAEEEERQLKEFRTRQKEDLEFPDEVEFPANISVKERLRRYRGLKNLRTCTWDVDEKDKRSPEEWPRLMRISNFKATGNRVIKEAALLEQSAGQQTIGQPGQVVRIYLRAPQNVVDAHANSPLAIFGLLQHEHKQAVVNLSISPDSDYSKPVASKDTLILQCGPRRLVIRPLFSQAGKSSNNVYKYERFLQHGRLSTATVMAPLMFGNVPVLYFKEDDNQGLDLVGTGTFLNADHSRILAKRIVITGHPLKINKRLVTIRYMFFNNQDVLWFKAVPLFTKLGRSGFIKESLGTHGYFKATFDGKISSQDTIAMALYKRVWPRRSEIAAL